MQTFIKVANYTHLMPTRYNLSDVDLKKVISTETMDNAEKKKDANKVCLMLIEDAACKACWLLVWACLWYGAESMADY